MRTLSTLAVLVVLLLNNVKAQELAASSIPAELKSRAGAVIRSLDTRIDIRGLEEVIYHERKVVTVLNEAGRDAAVTVLFYDKRTDIRYVKGQVFDADGLEIGRFTEKSFTDRSAVSDFSLYEDSRVKLMDPPVTSYPFTLVCEYEIRHKQTLLLPRWDFNPALGVAVAHATLTVTAKPGTELRYKEERMASGVTKGTTKEGLASWQWQLTNLKAMKAEPLCPDPEYNRVAVMLTLNTFSYDGVSGSFTNWEQYGKFVYDKLLANRSIISPATKDEITQLVNKISEPREQARKIYNWMQQKTRYVSVQVGIGGFQPASALETDQLSYGDCKGLVNYTRSLLAVAGIESWYCVVKSGTYKRSPERDFATMEFGDHIILCVPFKSDTTWLECTSKTLPFGFLSDFTDDRDVIACTPAGGKLLHTPSYNAAQSLQSRKAVFVVDDNGRLTGTMQTDFSGNQYDNRDELIAQSQKERLKNIGSVYATLSNIDVDTLLLEQDKGFPPHTRETITFTADGYASPAANRLFMPLNRLNVISATPKEVTNRVNPLCILRGYTDLDEISYQLPAGYTVEALPPPLHIDKSFGMFDASAKVEGNKLVYTRRMQINGGTYPAEAYGDYVDFYAEIMGADGRKAVLVKK